MTDSLSGLIDISRPLDPDVLPQWPGSPRLELERWLDMGEGDPATDTRVSMSLHAGTHLDAPAHRIPGGAPVDAIGLDRLNGACYVADVRGHRRVTETVLDGAEIPDDCGRLLLCTDNSADSTGVFNPDFVDLTPGAAERIANLPITVLGVDYLSVEGPEGGGRVHEILLEARVVLLEGLDLAGVSDGHYRLLCLPIRFVGTEAAPVRACLVASEP